MIRSLPLIVLLVLVFGEDDFPSPSATPPQSLDWLMKQFTNGRAAMPRSWKDILPSGESFWDTPAYRNVRNAMGKKIPLDTRQAIAERNMHHWGTRLEDAAVWQIALSIWDEGRHAEMYERNVLYTDATGSANPDSTPGEPAGLTSLRLVAKNFQYGKILAPDLAMVSFPGNSTKPAKAKHQPPIRQVQGGYFQRTITPRYFVVDPLLGATAMAYQTPWPNTEGDVSWDTSGVIFWDMWETSTGTNVYATIIGPLQRLYIENGGKIGNSSKTLTCGTIWNVQPCTWTSWNGVPNAIQLALSIWPALEALQSPTGGWYTTPNGDPPFNLPQNTPDPNYAQLLLFQDNAVAYAGFSMLNAVLKMHIGTPSMATGWVAKAINELPKWINGTKTWLTKGKVATWKTGTQQWKAFYYGMHDTAPIPMNGAAFDVATQLTAILAMGPASIDKAYGSGTSYTIWQTVKHFAGVGGSNLVGVGIGGMMPTGGKGVAPNNKLVATQNTLMAIMACQMMAMKYSSNPTKHNSLTTDYKQMQAAISSPTTQGGAVMADGSYRDANMRQQMASGWYINPVGATGATSWSILGKQLYNPFILGGGKISLPVVSPPPNPTPPPGGKGSKVVPIVVGVSIAVVVVLGLVAAFVVRRQQGGGSEKASLINKQGNV